ncbi:TlpA family protein disulfide reductase [Candidatus Poribacteria bacterium]|nr:TlpA family protein disulfide reductase [Candidatus Poribacteria bacterium]
MRKLQLNAATLLILILVLVPSCATSDDLSGTGNMKAATPPAQAQTLRKLVVGDLAPPFAINTLDGRSYDLKKETEGKVVSIVFWSIFCAPCRRSIPIMNDIYKELRDRQFELVAVNMDGKKMIEGVKAYVAEEGIVFPVLMDELVDDSLKVADPYGVQGTPMLFLIDKRGYITFSKAGDLERDELRAMILSEMGGSASVSDKK